MILFENAFGETPFIRFRCSRMGAQRYGVTSLVLTDFPAIIWYQYICAFILAIRIRLNTLAMAKALLPTINQLQHVANALGSNAAWSSNFPQIVVIGSQVNAL